MYNLSAHPETFSAGYSLKGLLDVLMHSGEYGLDQVLGPQSTSIANWHAVNLIEHAQKFADANSCGKTLRIRFYSGPNDWFLPDNRLFDTTLTGLSVAHEYFENNEAHTEMTPARVFDALKWEDSVLVHQGSVGVIYPPKADRRNAKTLSLGKNIRYDLFGRALKPGENPGGMVIEYSAPADGNGGRFVRRMTLP